MGASNWGSRPRAATALLGLMLACAAAAEAPPAEQAEVMPLAATRSVILGFAESDARAIAVGERGHVLLSESRSDWRQVAEVPTRATLTAVAAVGDSVWAVGHDGMILHSGDGGLSWSIQRSDPWVPPAEDEDPFSRDPRLGAPLLDVLFVDADNGYAIGAYALALRTRDGGKTWEKIDLSAASDTATDQAAAEEAAPADDAGAAADDESWTFDQSDLDLAGEMDPHLNGIARSPDGTLVIVAERGAAFRSTDGGDTWARIQLPYDGSMFGVLALADGHFIAYGLRGNVLESRDGAQSWSIVETGIELSLMGAAPLGNGGVVIVGTNGVLLHRPDGASPLVRSTYENDNNETPVLADVLPLGPRTLLVCGERGIGRFQLN